MSVKEVAIRKAVSILSSVGAQFKIIDSDGKEYGELLAVKARPARHSYVDHYREQMEALTVGGVATINATDKSAAEGIRAAAQAWAIKKWGKGSTITALAGSRVEVLRVH